MTRARQDRVIALLERDGEWMTAATLADALGVTPRSIRSYVTAINGRRSGGDAIESGALGYRIDREALEELRRAAPQATPRDRLHRLVRTLLEADDGVDVDETATLLHVSLATLNADLGRVRALLAADPLTLDRTDNLLRLRGPETAKRRLISRLVHDEMDADALDMGRLRRSLGGEYVAADALAAFKADLVAALAAQDVFVNEYGITDVLLHVAIAVDRAARRRAVEEPAGTADAGIAELVGRLARAHFDIDMGPAETGHLAALIMTRVVGRDGRADVADRLDPVVAGAVRGAVGRAATEFGVDLMDDDFLLRLSLHVQNLRQRAQTGAWSRNPLTRSLKTNYPMIFEIAVVLAADLRSVLGVDLQDDELAYIAMHVGGRLERSRRAESIVTATIVCPGYYELHELLRSSVDRSLGRTVEVVGVETRVDPDWTGIDTDLILTTVPTPLPTERAVQVQPFLTEQDIEHVQQAAARVRRARRLARLRDELEQYFVPTAFVRGFEPDDEPEAVIRRLGALLVADGVIGEDYVRHTLERERLSSTAFTDALAVPHAMTMSASRTAIAVQVGEASMPWGDSRVQVVAFVAFGEGDRPAFQTVFEQLVEVFSERDSVQRIVRRGTTFTGFLDELVAVIDG